MREVVETMDAWGGTGDVSLSCASRLSYLAFNDKEGREALVCALEPIVRLMMRCTRRHWVEALPADPKVQAHCCSALGSISSGSTERSLSAVRAGGVKAIVNAMRSHPADREVQFQGAAAMALSASPLVVYETNLTGAGHSSSRPTTQG